MSKPKSVVEMPTSFNRAALPPDKPNPNWQSLLLTSESPRKSSSTSSSSTAHPLPLPLLYNCLIALRHSPEFHTRLRWNDITHSVYYRQPAPWQPANSLRIYAEWTDQEDRQLAAWLQAQNIRVTTSIAAEAAATVAHDHIYNPLLDYLSNLTWDNWKRVDTWLTTYLSAPDTEFTRAVGKAWLVSAVARAYQPGCKADHCLILEGDQGNGKSSALRTLAGEEFFSDYMPADLGSKEAQIHTGGVWIVEFPELQSVISDSKKFDAVKAFLTRTDDRYRPVWASRPIRVRRQCVFAGTTNRDTYLPDETGNRRFWPVPVGTIDLAGLERDRNKLWAEAVKLYLEGKKWWLDPYTEEEARQHQAARYDQDVWAEQVVEWLERLGKARVSTSDVLAQCLKRDGGNRSDQMRVAAVLRSLGWKKHRLAGQGRIEWRKPE